MNRTRSLLLAVAALSLGACGQQSSTGGTAPMAAPAMPPMPDPRVGLRAGLFDAAEAAWNMRVLSETPPSQPFVGAMNSDLAFTGHYAIQGNFNGFQVWDIADPRHPVLVEGYVCPASQSDVSVYRNLLFVSGESMGARLDCGTTGVSEAVSRDRLRGIRIFDITDIHNPRYIANVQTCRGSHTHSLLVPANDPDNVYVYVSGSAQVRPAAELPGCVAAPPERDSASALFRIEVIRVPLAHPEQAAIVSSPRIFNDLLEPATHGEAPADLEALRVARARGAFVLSVGGESLIVPDEMARPVLDSVVRAAGRTGTPTHADSAAVRSLFEAMAASMAGPPPTGNGPRPGPTQCHDITLYPALNLAGGACEGYGILLDISNPTNPVRVAAVSDSNFSYWHSATFNNDGTKVLFSDEWGGGSGPKCRASDPMQWGADAIFTISERQLQFRSYYKLPAAQTPEENCVAHNGSLIPIPGRDVMVQAWYQGGISVFDWTDAARPIEIAYFDRGPMDSTEMRMAGSWSVYWYNGVIVSSEIARGLDIFELTPSPAITANEIAAARTVHLDYLNTQGQPRFVWPASFALARAYLDQLERSRGLTGNDLSGARAALTDAERAMGAARSSTLTALADRLDSHASGSSDEAKVRLVAGVVRDLAGM